MTRKFLEMTMTDAVREAQEKAYGHSRTPQSTPGNDQLGPDEIEFIQARDSFYMATVNEGGWPYLQHRGGAPGFLTVPDPTTLAFGDYQGNRQLLSTGNVNANDRVALFLMDYPNRVRLKILGRARIEPPTFLTQSEGAAAASAPRIERVFVIDVVAYDWNCPKYITPRFSVAEVERIVSPLTRRIAELEREIASRTDSPQRPPRTA